MSLCMVSNFPHDGQEYLLISRFMAMAPDWMTFAFICRLLHFAPTDCKLPNKYTN